MKKILIVKRRKKESQTNNGQSLTGNPSVFEPNQSSEIFLNDPVPISHDSKDENAVSDKSDRDQTLSFALTPEQTEFIRSNADVASLLESAPHEITVDVEQVDGGGIFFHFHVQKFQGIRMLKTDEVCRMLQVSKSFLMMLVRENRIKSYKIGRLRRFSLEDILEYLARSEESV